MVINTVFTCTCILWTGKGGQYRSYNYHKADIESIGLREYDIRKVLIIVLHI